MWREKTFGINKLDYKYNVNLCHRYLFCMKNKSPQEFMTKAQTLSNDLHCMSGIFAVIWEAY